MTIAEIEVRTYFERVLDDPINRRHGITSDSEAFRSLLHAAQSTDPTLKRRR